MIWAIFSQVQATLRHQGQEESKIYLVDESFFTVSAENSGVYWGYIYDSIKDDENRSHMFNVIKNYFLGVATNLVGTLCKAMYRAKLDEAETCALLMLLFTNPSSLLVLTDHTREMLKEWKNQTFEGIADHIERTGRNVDERMAEIVFLLTEFQVNQTNLKITLYLFIV